MLQTKVSAYVYNAFAQKKVDILKKKKGTEVPNFTATNNFKFLLVL